MKKTYSDCFYLQVLRVSKPDTLIPQYHRTSCRQKSIKNTAVSHAAALADNLIITINLSTVSLCQVNPT